MRWRVMCTDQGFSPIAMVLDVHFKSERVRGPQHQLSGSYACEGSQPCSFYSRYLQWFRWRMRLPKAQQDAAQCPVPSLAAPSVGDAARLLVLPPERPWGVTGGIGITGITGAMVVAGSAHRAEDPTRYRIAIAGERYDCTVAAAIAIPAHHDLSL
jgi:hypothetical protein